MRLLVDWDDGAVERRLRTTLLVQRWSREGMYELATGDFVIVRAGRTSDAVVWQGTVRSRKQFHREPWLTWLSEHRSATVRKPLERAR